MFRYFVFQNANSRMFLFVVYFFETHFFLATSWHFVPRIAGAFFAKRQNIRRSKRSATIMLVLRHAKDGGEIAE